MNEAILIRDTLKSFAEDMRKEMSVNVYEGIWNIIQGIDKNLEDKK